MYLIKRLKHQTYYVYERILLHTRHSGIFLKINFVTISVHEPMVKREPDDFIWQIHASNSNKRQQFTPTIGRNHGQAIALCVRQTRKSKYKQNSSGVHENLIVAVGNTNIRKKTFDAHVVLLVYKIKRQIRFF